MLDAYIIERIKREQEQSDSSRIPLHKEPQRPSPESTYERDRERWRDRRERTPERGVVIIDM